MSLILNIYDKETKAIDKTYTAETVDIMFGTVEDIIEVIDLDKLNDNMAWAKVIGVAIKQLRPLLKEVFDGLTDEELKCTKIKELIPLFKEIFKFMMNEINDLGGGTTKK
jgi:hypothetical protein